MTTAFVYYRPGSGTRPSDDELVPLSYMLGRPPAVSVRETRAGPDGQGSGALFWRSDNGFVGAFLPDRQRWLRVGDTPVSVGVSDDAPLPGPDDLRRERQLPGRLVELGDGRRWLVPTVREWVEENGAPRWRPTLPTEPTQNEAGEWVAGEIDRDYQELWEASLRWWDAQEAAALTAKDDEGPAVVTLDEGLTAALSALQINYRIGAAEAQLLGLFRHERGADVLNAMIDWHGLIELNAALEKKRTAGCPARDT